MFKGDLGSLQGDRWGEVFVVISSPFLFTIMLSSPRCTRGIDSLSQWRPLPKFGIYFLGLGVIYFFNELMKLVLAEQELSFRTSTSLRQRDSFYLDNLSHRCRRSTYILRYCISRSFFDRVEGDIYTFPSELPQMSLSMIFWYVLSFILSFWLPFLLLSSSNFILYSWSLFCSRDNFSFSSELRQRNDWMALVARISACLSIIDRSASFSGERDEEH